MENTQLLSKDHDGHSGDPRKSPVRWEKKKVDNEKENGDKVLVQQNGAPSQRETYCKLLQESIQRNQHTT